MNDILTKIEELKKAFELGSYNVAPTQLNQGSAVQKEDLSKIMHVVTFGEKDIKLQKEVKVEKARGQLIQFNRMLSYGTFGGTAMSEGLIGQEETPDIVRAAVPMAYYSLMTRPTIAATMAETFDGVSAEERVSMAAAMKIAGDVEFDLFRGKADFSNAGVFDGNPNAIAQVPNMVGLDVQVRQSDYSLDTQDLMFEAYGSGLSNIISGGAVLTQSNVEDAWIRGVMNFSKADRMFTDPLVLSNYSKNAYSSKERFNLGSTAAEPVTGVDIRRQAVSGGVVTLEPSRFLSGQTKWKRSRNNSPGAPTFTSAQAGSTTTFTASQVYQYVVTAENELGESLPSASASVTIATNGNRVTLTITAGTGTARYFNVFRTAAGGAVASAKLIGRVKAAVSGTTDFVDLNNRVPGAQPAYLVDMESMAVHELAPYSRIKLAVTDLTQPEGHFRFCTVAVYQPRKNVLIDNLTGAL